MARNTLRRYYKKGEVGLIEWEIRPNIEYENIVIDEAKYEILKDGIVIDANDIDKPEYGKNVIGLAFDTTRFDKGEYLIRVFVTVHPETRIAEIIAQIGD